MQGIDVGLLLRRFLDECDKCRQHFDENVALICDGPLSEEQVEAVIIMLNEKHGEHE